jgi:hypothetical protein
MSLYSNHQPEVVAAVNGNPSEADWREYNEWSEGLSQKLPDPQPELPPIRTVKAGKKEVAVCLVLVIGPDTYLAEPLDPHPDVARKAWRLSKNSADLEVYDVRLTGRGPECDCKGFIRWQKPCKHCQALAALKFL